MSHKSASQWDTYHARAKLLEARLEKKVQNYSSIAQRINADFLCDEENPLIEDSDEQLLAGEIERDLTELNDCIQVMRQQHHLSNHQEVMVKRYHEIHFDYRYELCPVCL